MRGPTNHPKTFDNSDQLVIVEIWLKMNRSIIWTPFSRGTKYVDEVTAAVDIAPSSKSLIWVVWLATKQLFNQTIR